MQRRLGSGQRRADRGRERRHGVLELADGAGHRRRRRPGRAAVARARRGPSGLWATLAYYGLSELITFNQAGPFCQLGAGTGAAWAPTAPLILDGVRTAARACKDAEDLVPAGTASGARAGTAGSVGDAAAAAGGVAGAAAMAGSLPPPTTPALRAMPCRSACCCRRCPSLPPADIYASYGRSSLYLALCVERVRQRGAVRERGAWGAFGSVSKTCPPPYTHFPKTPPQTCAYP